MYILLPGMTERNVAFSWTLAIPIEVGALDRCEVLLVIRLVARLLSSSKVSSSLLPETCTSNKEKSITCYQQYILLRLHNSTIRWKMCLYRPLNNSHWHILSMTGYWSRKYYLFFCMGCWVRDHTIIATKVRLNILGGEPLCASHIRIMVSCTYTGTY